MFDLGWKFAASLVLVMVLTAPASAAPDKVMPEIPAPSLDEGPGLEDIPFDALTPEQPDTTAPAADDQPIPQVEYDIAKLPAPVKRLREQLIEAASSGDIEKLRPIIEANGEPPQLSFNDIDDPIAYLKSLSGDAEGREILAILIEVLEAGFVHDEIGTPDEVYIWPYFANYPVDKLDARQLVELFKLVYAGDYEDMKADGHYLFYRVGIAPNGVWKYFIAGD